MFGRIPRVWQDTACLLLFNDVVSSSDALKLRRVVSNDLERRVGRYRIVT